MTLPTSKVMIDPKCSKCNKWLNNFGALLFSPPCGDSKVTKYHICVDCWDSVESFIQETPCSTDSNVESFQVCGINLNTLLSTPFWPSTLNTTELYQRTHDDHDGTYTGSINITLDPMGDVHLLLEPNLSHFNRNLRFRTPGGGGQSERVRTALLILAEAIRLDNLERPQSTGPTSKV